MRQNNWSIGVAPQVATSVGAAGVKLGIPVEMASERGVVAPAGTPPAILARLREATEDIARDPEFVKQLEDRFTEPAWEEGESWFARLRGQEAEYRALWQRTPWAQR